MMTASTLVRGATVGDGGTRERVRSIARWLAHQSAAPLDRAEATAWRVADDARSGVLPLDGPKAPLVVQGRYALWLVGQLGGPTHIRVFTEQDAAVAKAREIGRERRVPVLVIDQGGELERVDPIDAAPTVAAFAPPGGRAQPTLRIARHEDRWAVFVAGRVVATAPTRERARARARVLRADPDFMADPQPLPPEAP
ncbi:MAG: hypothetical protein U1F43_37920 [Myxococcota bacterium]